MGSAVDRERAAKECGLNSDDLEAAMAGGHACARTDSAREYVKTLGMMRRIDPIAEESMRDCERVRMPTAPLASMTQGRFPAQCNFLNLDE